jgi:hypothetical protein
MIKRIHIYVLIALLSGGVVSAEEQAPSKYEKAVIGMINAARQNPLAIAASLGMDTDKLIRDLPELADIFKNGLAPLTFHSKLYQSASLHAQDMMDKKYYSAVSPDKKGIQERILETGYIPIASGESLGMLSFGNFMEPDKAVKAIFHNMFADELDPARSEKRNILNPDIKEVGISLKAGVFDFDSSPENVYLVVCDFGNSDTSVLESLLLNMINDARKIPEQIIITSAANTDKGVMLAAGASGVQEYPAGAAPPVQDAGTAIPGYQLPALSVNEKLTEAAENHTQDILERLYFDNISPDGKAPVERAEEAGYDAMYMNETLGAIGFEHFLDPKEAVRIFYEHIIQKDINASLTNKSIFNAAVSDIGMNFDVMLLDMGNGKTLKIYVLTIEVGVDRSIFSGGTDQTFDKFYILLNN